VGITTAKKDGWYKRKEKGGSRKTALDTEEDG
jgi:hypothetical protein